MPKIKDPDNTRWAGFLPVPSDLKFHWKVLLEKYRLHYPCVEYFIYNTSVANYDTLWGETMPQSMDPTKVELDKIDIRSIDKYQEPFKIRTYVNQNSSNYGVALGLIDGIKEEFTAWFLVPSLIELGFVAKAGDKFFWNDYYYKILRAKPSKYWANTNLYSYIECSCERFRLGS